MDNKNNQFCVCQWSAAHLSLRTHKRACATVISWSRSLFILGQVAMLKYEVSQRKCAVVCACACEIAPLCVSVC